MKPQEDHKVDLSFNQKVKSETDRGIELWQRKGQWNIAMVRNLSHWLDRQADEVNEKTGNNEWLFSSPWVHIIRSRLSAPTLNAQTPRSTDSSIQGSYHNFTQPRESNRVEARRAAA